MLCSGFEARRLNNGLMGLFDGCWLLVVWLLSVVARPQTQAKD